MSVKTTIQGHDVGGKKTGEKEDHIGTKGDEIIEWEGKLLQLDLQSVTGLMTKRSLKLWGEMQGKEATRIVDYGASRNFITRRIVEQFKLPTVETPQF